MPRGFCLRAARVGSCAAVVAAVALAGACAGFGGRSQGVWPPVPAGVEPAAEVQGEALDAQDRTRPRGASSLVFQWSAREPDFRGSGIGVARVEPPYRARLDLFLDNGETVAIAALVDDELRIPESLPTGLVPPAPLMWAALGVFRPGTGAEMLQGSVADGTMQVRYRLRAGDQVGFRLRDDALRDAVLLDGDVVVQHVFVSKSAAGVAFPDEATYRNLPDYRELKLILESVEDVDSFPPDIWTPRG